MRRHPLALLRPQLTALKLSSAAELHAMRNGRVVRGCGIVTIRQQPETAKGTVFISLEDETGDIQIIVRKEIWQRQRQDMLQAKLLAVRGTWQSQDGVHNLIAGFLEDLTPMLGRLKAGSRDFH